MKPREFIKTVAISAGSSLILGEILFWVFLLVGLTLLLRRESSTDVEPMLFFLILGLYVRPVIFIILVMVVFWLCVIKAKALTNPRDVIVAAMTMVFVSVFVLISSAAILAAELGIPVSGIPEIYLQFTR